MYIRTN